MVRASMFCCKIPMFSLWLASFICIFQNNNIQCYSFNGIQESYESQIIGDNATFISISNNKQNFSGYLRLHFFQQPYSEYMNYDHRRYVRCSNDFTVNFIIEAAPESLPLKSLNVSMYKGYSNLADIHQHCKWITRKDGSIDNCPMGELDNLGWLSDSDKVGNTVVVQHYHNDVLQFFQQNTVASLNGPNSDQLCGQFVLAKMLCTRLRVFSAITPCLQQKHKKLIKDYEKVFGKSKITPVRQPGSFTWTLVHDCHQPIDTKNATGTVFTAEPRIPRDFESTDIKLDRSKKDFYVQIWLEGHGIEPVCLPMKKQSPHQFAPSHFPPNLIKKETKIPSKQ